MLIGGETGSGKSTLLKLLLAESIRKGGDVYIADFKGGIDFPQYGTNMGAISVQMRIL